MARMEEFIRRRSLMKVVVVIVVLVFVQRPLALVLMITNHM